MTAWRCVADDPVGVPIPGVEAWERKPVCHIHGTKDCVVKRAIHHVQGCAQAKVPERSTGLPPRSGLGQFRKVRPKAYCVQDVTLVTCTNCLAKLRKLGLLKDNPMEKKPTGDKPWVHPFEQAGLGKAPFRLVGVTTKKYQATRDAPVQPGGSCDFCGQAIMYVARIRGADGREFDVGLDCAERTGDTKLIEAARREQKKLRRERNRARAEAIREERIATLEERVGDTLRRLDAQAERRTWGRSIAADMATQLRNGRVDDLTPKQYELLERIEDEDEQTEEIEPVKPEAVPSESEYVGEVGERLKLTLILDRMIDFETKFGWRRIIKMHDEAGNQFVWRTNTAVRIPDEKSITYGPKLDERHILIDGEKFECTATVKDHSQYNGVKQTELTRLKVNKVLEWRDKRGKLLEVRFIDAGYIQKYWDREAWDRVASEEGSEDPETSAAWSEAWNKGKPSGASPKKPSPKKPSPKKPSPKKPSPPSGLVVGDFVRFREPIRSGGIREPLFKIAAIEGDVVKLVHPTGGDAWWSLRGLEPVHLASLVKQPPSYEDVLGYTSVNVVMQVYEEALAAGVGDPEKIARRLTRFKRMAPTEKSLVLEATEKLLQERTADPRAWLAEHGPSDQRPEGAPMATSAMRTWLQDNYWVEEKPGVFSNPSVPGYRWIIEGDKLRWMQGTTDLHVYSLAAFEKTLRNGGTIEGLVRAGTKRPSPKKPSPRKPSPKHPSPKKEPAPQGEFSQGTRFVIAPRASLRDADVGLWQVTEPPYAAGRPTDPMFAFRNVKPDGTLGKKRRSHRLSMLREYAWIVEPDAKPSKYALHLSGQLPLPNAKPSNVIASYREEVLEEALAGAKVLFRAPEDASLWAIPYDMKPGQQPSDLGPGPNTKDWVWLGSPGWYGDRTEGEIEVIEDFLAKHADHIPRKRFEWTKLAEPPKPPEKPISKAPPSQSNPFGRGDAVEFKHPKGLLQIGTKIVDQVSGDDVVLLEKFRGQTVRVPASELEQAWLTNDYAWEPIVGDIVARAKEKGSPNLEAAAKGLTRFRRSTEEGQRVYLALAHKFAASGDPADVWRRAPIEMRILDPSLDQVLGYLEGDDWLRKQLQMGAKLDNGLVLNREAFKILTAEGLVDADVPISDLDPAAGVIAGASGAVYIVMPDGEVVLDGASVGDISRAVQFMRVVHD